VKVVHRPEATPESSAPAKQNVQLSPEEVRALLDVSGPGYRAPTSWRRGIILLPAGGAVWLVRRVLPWPFVLLLFILWLALFGWEVRRYLVTSRRW
jgi:hypothetical protein